MKIIAKAVDLAARHTWLWSNRSAFTQPFRGGKPRLLVDVSAILQHDAQTGIQRVVRAVWSELTRRNANTFALQPVYATNSAGYCYAPLDFLRSNPEDVTKVPVSAGPGDKFLGLDLTAHLLPKYRQQITAWRTNGATVHLVVYDVLPLFRPDWFSPAMVRNFRNWFEMLADHAHQALCISDKVVCDLRQELERRKKGPQLEIARMSMGGDIGASVPSSGLDAPAVNVLKHIRTHPAILMVGTIEPRKGYDVALAAFEYLWNTSATEAPYLVILGRRGWRTGDLQERFRSHPEHGRRLHWLEGVSDEGLCQFYTGSCGLLMASYDEGFGLPMLEAATYGCPVLARDIPVFREQGLSNLLFFDDDRPEALARRLMEFLGTNQKMRSTATKAFTWGECVDGLLRELELGPEYTQDLLQPLRKAS